MSDKFFHSGDDSKSSINTGSPSARACLHAEAYAAAGTEFGAGLNTFAAWACDNVAKPLYNSAIVQPYNALANGVNAVPDALGAGHILPKLSVASVESAPLMSAEWLAQNISSGLGAALPYALAGKTASLSMRSCGNRLGLRGGLARIAASDGVAQVVGAAALDGLRDRHAGESRLGNVVAGSSAFMIFGLGNRFAHSLSLTDRVFARGLTGALGGVAQASVSRFVSDGTLPDVRQLSEAVVSSATMNVALPAVHGQLKELSNAVTTRWLNKNPQSPVSEYVVRNGLAGKSATVDALVEWNPLARVRESSTSSSIDHSRNVVHLDRENALPRLGHELTHDRKMRSTEAHKNFKAAADALLGGDEDTARHLYVKTRQDHESSARLTEAEVWHELGNSSKAADLIRDVQLFSEAAAGKRARVPGLVERYESRWLKEFEQFKASGGRFRPKET